MQHNIALGDLMDFIKPRCRSIYTLITEEIGKLDKKTDEKVIFSLIQGYLNGVIDTAMAYSNVTTSSDDEDKAKLRRLLIPVLMQYENKFADIKRKTRKEQDSSG